MEADRQHAHARAVVTRPVTEAVSLDELFEGSLPAFGGAFLRRVWSLLDEAIGSGIPMTMAVAGPVTLSGQHLTWLCPLLDTGWFMLVSTTDAVCYHDGHRALNSAGAHPIHEVPIYGDDSALREQSTIRVTDLGFDEALLLDQDRFLRACLREKEFQRRMSGCELRYLLGRRYAAQERINAVPEGLLALCARKAIPIFVGAPADGSVFLNSLALWALRETTGEPYAFELDLHAEVFESLAYHRWSVRESDARAIGALILGGGVPKNYNLQPEPALSQILGFEDIPGYLYDIQLTTAPVSDGSLSSCPPSEAVTWGKVDKDHHTSTCESMPCDYSIVMPFLTKALLDKRARFARMQAEMGAEALFERHPKARGYLRDEEGYRLFERRSELVGKLMEDVRARSDSLRGACAYPLAPLDDHGEHRDHRAGASRR
jgi:deoxyhypusine synthase